MNLTDLNNEKLNLNNTTPPIPTIKKNPKPKKVDNFYYDASKKDLRALLKDLQQEKDPQKFKNTLLKSMQLYFDGIVEQTNIGITNQYILYKQKETLNTMFKGLELALRAFYQEKQQIPFKQVKELIIPYKAQIVKHGSKDNAKVRHLNNKEKFIKRYLAYTTNALRDQKIDLIIPVASGGFEPAILTADYLEVNTLYPIRFSGIARRDKHVLTPPSNIQETQENTLLGKNILIIDDVISGGDTAKELIEWTKQYSPSKIYFSVVMNFAQDKKLLRHGLLSHNNSKYLYHTTDKK